MTLEAPLPVDLHSVPEPFEHNPSSWRQRIQVCLVAAIGFLIAAYMGLYQWRLIPTVWDPVFGAQTLNVLDSDLSHRLSRWFRIPDASFGALAYLGDIIFALAGSTRRWQYRPWLVVVFGFDVIPLGIVSVILVFCQAFLVGAWCLPCLVTAAISILLIVLAYDEVWSCLLLLWRVWRRSQSAAQLWRTLWGQPSDVAQQVADEMVQQRAGRRKRKEHRSSCGPE